VNPPLDEHLLARLANDSGLFHLDDTGKPLARALTFEPLKAVATHVSGSMRTLETGCGGSTVVFAALGARHTVVTPSEAEADRVKRFCAENRISVDRVDFRIGSSDDVLTTWEEPLDAILIDGAHRMPYPLIDWHYAGRRLRVGGVLLLDDVAIPAVHVLYEFLRGEEEWTLLRSYGDKLAVFRKNAEPVESHIGDWEVQRYNLPWRYGHVPMRRRWRRARDKVMIRTRLQRALQRES
jgi:predicted O-methyltransferase YrrM